MVASPAIELNDLYFHTQGAKFSNYSLEALSQFGIYSQSALK